MKGILNVSVGMLSIVASLVSVNVAAAAKTAPAKVEQQNHFYLLGGAGIGILKDSHVTDDFQVEDGTDLALRFGIGYQLNKYFGAEANYIYFSPVESDLPYGNKIEASAQSLAILGVAKYPIEKFAFFVKAGPSYNIKKLEIVEGSGYFNDGGQEETEEEWEAAYGGGVEYNFTKAWGTQVEYLVTGEDTSALTANVVFRF